MVLSNIAAGELEAVRSQVPLAEPVGLLELLLGFNPRRSMYDLFAIGAMSAPGAYIRMYAYRAYGPGLSDYGGAFLSNWGGLGGQPEPRVHLLTRFCILSCS